ncbi:hypothetical protein D3C76_1227740 [compost metagenome]
MFPLFNTGYISFNNIAKFWNASKVTWVKNGSPGAPPPSFSYIDFKTSAIIDATFAGSDIAKGFILNVPSGLPGSTEYTSMSKFFATDIKSDINLPSFSTTVIPRFL